LYHLFPKETLKMVILLYILHLKYTFSTVVCKTV